MLPKGLGYWWHTCTRSKNCFRTFAALPVLLLLLPDSLTSIESLASSPSLTSATDHPEAGLGGPPPRRWQWPHAHAGSCIRVQPSGCQVCGGFNSDNRRASQFHWNEEADEAETQGKSGAFQFYLSSKHQGSGHSRIPASPCTTLILPACSQKKLSGDVSLHCWKLCRPPTKAARRLFSTSCCLVAAQDLARMPIGSTQMILSFRSEHKLEAAKTPQLRKAAREAAQPAKKRFNPACSVVEHACSGTCFD